MMVRLKNERSDSGKIADMCVRLERACSYAYKAAACMLTHMQGSAALHMSVCMRDSINK